MLKFGERRFSLVLALKFPKESYDEKETLWMWRPVDPIRFCRWKCEFRLSWFYRGRHQPPISRGPQSEDCVHLLGSVFRQHSRCRHQLDSVRKRPGPGRLLEW